MFESEGEFDTNIHTISLHNLINDSIPKSLQLQGIAANVADHIFSSPTLSSICMSCAKRLKLSIDSTSSFIVVIENGEQMQFLSVYQEHSHFN